MRPEQVTRRSFVQISLGAAAVGVLVASGVPAAVLRTLQLTPAVADADEALTPAQTEGPYFKRDSPERWSLLETDTAGTRLVITGRVLDRFAQPQAAALLDFWQADDAGNYDNVTFRLRGHQFTDDNGVYT